MFAEDAGEYTVIATNSVGDARTSCYVFITDAATAAAVEMDQICPPGFLYVFDDLTVDVGKPCMLRVTVSGNPPPKVCLYIFPHF